MCIWTGADSETSMKGRGYPCVSDFPSLPPLDKREGLVLYHILPGKGRRIREGGREGGGGTTLWPYQLPSTCENGYSQSYCSALPDPACSLWLTKHEIIAKKASKGLWKSLDTHCSNDNVNHRATINKIMFIMELCYAKTYSPNRGQAWGRLGLHFWSLVPPISSVLCKCNDPAV